MMATQGFNSWAAIGQAIEETAPKVVRKIAFDLEGNVKKHIVGNDLVDTGFMLNSPYVVTADESTYKGGERALAEVPRPSDKNTAYTAVAAEYAIYPNYGTSHQAARPFWEPAIEDTKPGFDAAMSIIKNAIEDAAR